MSETEYHRVIVEDSRITWSGAIKLGLGVGIGLSMVAPLIGCFVVTIITMIGAS